MYRRWGQHGPPFGRPPGRRRVLARFWPELTAIAAYALLLVVMLTYVAIYPHRGEDAFCLGGAAAYALVGLALLVFPVTLAAMSWSHEHERGTIESLLLTPVDRADVVKSRFRGVVLPVVRLLAWSVPIYLIVSAGELSNEFSGSDWWFAVVAYVFGPKWFIIVLAGADCDGPHAAAIVSILLRIPNDFSLVLFSAALAYFISARLRRVGTAILVSQAAVIGLMWTLLAADTWAGILVGLTTRDEDAAFGTAAVVAVLLFAARLYLAGVLVRRVAARFDRYALGEQALS